MKSTKTIGFIAIPLALSLATVAAADEPGRLGSARRAGILAVMQGPRVQAPYAAPSAAQSPAVVAERGPATTGRQLCRSGEQCEALGTVPWSRPLFRSVGSCDAETLAEIESEVGRLGAIEQCTGRGDASPMARPFRGAVPRSAFVAKNDPESDPIVTALDL